MMAGTETARFEAGHLSDPDLHLDREQRFRAAPRARTAACVGNQSATNRSSAAATSSGVLCQHSSPTQGSDLAMASTAFGPTSRPVGRGAKKAHSEAVAYEVISDLLRIVETGGR